MTIEVEAKRGAFKSIRLVQMIAGFVNGLSYDQIAKQNNISEETARTYAKRLREEFHAKDKAEVVAKAIARGLITIKENGKTFLLCFLVFGSGFIDSDHDYTRFAKTKIKPRIERRANELV